MGSIGRFGHLDVLIQWYLSFQTLLFKLNACRNVNVSKDHDHIHLEIHSYNPIPLTKNVTYLLIPVPFHVPSS